MRGVQERGRSLRVFVDPYLVHLHSSEYGRIHMHTPASFLALADRVKHVADTTPAALALEEQTTGIKWDSEGLLLGR